MRPKLERTRQGSGPLSAEELRGLFDRGYSPGARRALAERWEIAGEVAPEAIAAAIEAPARVEARLGTLSPRERAVLVALVAQGGRARGENFRKELLFRGFGDCGSAIGALVARGLIVPLPGSGEVHLELDAVLEQGAYLQLELVVISAAVCDRLAGEEAAQPEELGAWEGQVEEITHESLASLELNLLQLTNDLQRETLRLNKSGTPNRRSLGKFSPQLAFPGDVSDSELDLSDPAHLDYVAFLLALCEELGLLTRDGASVRAAHAPCEAYFCQEQEPRIARLMHTLHNLKHWSELLSARLQQGRGELDALLDDQLSLTHDNGTILIGARGYVRSVLRRASFTGWTPLDAIVALCVQLDRDYLPRVLSKAGADVEPSRYVEALITHTMAWTGAVELGRAADGQALVRFTAQGAQMLGMQRDEVAQAPDPAQEKCMIVQPNFEAMVFLDHASTATLYRMYQLGARVALADRVATFKLSPASVQRGYSQGLDAARALAFLQARSHIPVDESVAFQLRDWERVFNRLVIHADGVLLRHSDLDRLDLIVGQLKHQWRAAPEVQLMRLTAGAAYVQGAPWEDIQRVIERERGLCIDYLGDIPPSLTFTAPLELCADPLRCDLSTWHTLERIGQPLTERDTRRARHFRLEYDAITALWPDDPLGQVTRFLDARTQGGLPPEQALKLRALLGAPSRVRVQQDVVVVRIEGAEEADLFARIPAIQAILIERVGAQTFVVRAASRAALDEVLERIGARMAREQR